MAGTLVIGSGVLLAGCAGRNTGALDEARAAVERARADQTVVVYAPDKLQDAQEALRRTEVAYHSHGPRSSDHFAYVAEQRAAIAQAIAGENAAQAEIEELGKEHDELLLEVAIARSPRSNPSCRPARPPAGWSSPWATSVDVDRAQLTRGGRPSGRQAGRRAAADADRNVLIEGHTDSAGSEAYNLDLSQRRAREMENLLIVQGVDPKRIVTRAYGEDYPVASNATAAGRQQNRRVEVVVLNPGRSDAPRAALQ